MHGARSALKSLVGLVAFGLAACTPPAPAATPALAMQKLGAPVSISVSFEAGRAQVRVVAMAPGEAVRIDVRGVRGVEVRERDAQRTRPSLLPGQLEAFEVPFAQAAPGGDLVVTVAGQFGGMQTARVASFRVGEARARRWRAAPSLLGGRRVHALPAQRLP